MKNKITSLFLGIMLSLFTSAFAQEEGGMQNIYEQMNFQLFRGDEYVCEIQSQKVKATRLDKADKKVDLAGVVVEIFNRNVKDTPERQKPPLKVRITSDEGTYMKALDKDSNQMQDIVILKGNVIVHRYADITSATQKAVIESTVNCDQAQWNNNTGILNGSGHVSMSREDGTLTFTGTGMIYEIDKVGNKTGGLDSSEENLGGVLELLRDVKMEIKEKGPNGRALDNTLTTVTSRGTGRYDFDKRELRFNNDVNVLRSNMRIASDKLSIMLAEKDSKDNKFREMIAESKDNDVVRIRGKGNPNLEGPSDIGEWRASSRYARYKEDTGELLLTDNRPNFVPLAQLDNHVIRNETIRFFVREKRLFATGKRGETILNGNMGGPESASGQKTVIKFKDTLFFDQNKNLAQFTGDVRLTSQGIVMDSEKLRVDFTNLNNAGPEDAGNKVRKVTATDNVRLFYQGRRARCAKLEIVPNLLKNPKPDDKGRILTDQFVMSDTPAPEIEIPGGGYFQAKKITTTRFKKITSGKTIVLIHAIGPGSGLFGGSKNEYGAPSVPSGDATTIRYSTQMVYDELIDRVDFFGDVTATNGDQVLRSDQLMAWLTSSEGAEDKDKKEINRLVAVGNATMHWGLHHCEAASIDRRITPGKNNPNDRVVLNGTQQKQARIWEENGASFQGTQITATADGSTIYSQGGGELSMLDRDTNQRAMVIYSGDAYYKATGDTSFAIFRKNVIMRRGNMKVTGDRMRADMIAIKQPSAIPGVSAAADTGVSTATLPRKLKRVTVEGNVVIRQGKRMAFGSKGQVDVGDKGDVMILEGAQKQRAEVNDNNGFVLYAPRIMVKESSGIITASGPGEVRITGSGSAADAGVEPGLMSSNNGNYRLTYAGKLLYNMLLRNIRFEKDVKVWQDTLFGKCDSLRVYLNKAVGNTGEDTPVKVENIEAFGDVRFTRLPEPPAGRDPFSLVGNTVITRSEEAHYQASLRRILLISYKTQSDVISQEITPAGRKSRYLQRAQRIWIDTATGAIDVKDSQNKQQIVPLPTTGPLRFPGE